MYTEKEAYDILLKEYPKNKIISSRSLNDDFYLFEIEGESDFDGFKRVNKNTGEILSYSPLMDLEEFDRSLDSVTRYDEVKHGLCVNSEYIAHHGIKGQKWGVRRFQNYDGTLIKKSPNAKGHGGDFRGGFQDKQVSDRNNHNVTMTDSKGTLLTNVNSAAIFTAAKLALEAADSGNDDLKKAALAITAATAAVDAVALAHHGSVKLKENKYYKERMESVEKNGIDKKTGFPKKAKEYTLEEDIARVNPGFKNWNANTKNNCMLCTNTLELRRRGYDVTARKASWGYDEKDQEKWFKDAKPKQVGDTTPTSDPLGYRLGRDKNIENAKKVIDYMNKEPEGSRGNIMVRWAGTMAGHSMAYEIRNGKMVIIDSQSGKTYDKPEQILNNTWSASYVRLDDKEINPRGIATVAMVGDGKDTKKKLK